MNVISYPKIDNISGDIKIKTKQKQSILQINYKYIHKMTSKSFKNDQLIVNKIIFIDNKIKK